MSMKKKILIVCAILLLILVVPIPTARMKDGGSKEYIALTYKIIAWQHDCGDKIFEKTCIYFFPDNRLPVGELLDREMQKLKES